MSLVRLGMTNSSLSDLLERVRDSRFNYPRVILVKLDSSSKHHSLEAAYTESARDGAVWRGYTGLYTRRDELSCIRNLGLTLATIRIVQTLCKPIFVRYKEPYNDIYRTLVHMHRWDIHLYTTLSRVCTQSIQQGGCDKIAVSDSDL